jgi:hypothetical protein
MLNYKKTFRIILNYSAFLKYHSNQKSEGGEWQLILITHFKVINTLSKSTINLKKR